MLAISGDARPAPAQPVSEPALRAAFLVNFAKFAEWPQDVLPQGTSLEFCTVDDLQVADALESILKTMRDRAPGRSGVTRLTAAAALQPQDSPARRCHLIYAASFDRHRAAQLAVVLAEASVFSVGDSSGFAEGGGIAELYQEHGKLRFAINIDAAQRARLHLGASLLRLAKIVKTKGMQGP